MFLCLFQLPKGRRPESSGQVAEGSGEPDLLRDAELQRPGDPGGDQHQEEDRGPGSGLQEILRVRLTLLHSWCWRVVLEGNWATGSTYLLAVETVS